MKFYHVILGRRHIDLVKASTKEHAIALIEKIYGPASKYHTNFKYEAIEA